MYYCRRQMHPGQPALCFPFAMPLNRRNEGCHISILYNRGNIWYAASGTYRFLASLETYRSQILISSEKWLLLRLSPFLKIYLTILYLKHTTYAVDINELLNIFIVFYSCRLFKLSTLGSSSAWYIKAMSTEGIIMARKREWVFPEIHNTKQTLAAPITCESHPLCQFWCCSGTKLWHIFKTTYGNRITLLS